MLGELIRPLSSTSRPAQRPLDGTCSSAFQAIILAVCDYLLEVQKVPLLGSLAI